MTISKSDLKREAIQKPKKCHAFSASYGMCKKPYDHLGDHEGDGGFWRNGNRKPPSTKEDQ